MVSVLAILSFHRQQGIRDRLPLVTTSLDGVAQSRYEFEWLQTAQIYYSKTFRLYLFRRSYLKSATPARSMPFIRSTHRSFLLQYRADGSNFLRRR